VFEATFEFSAMVEETESFGAIASIVPACEVRKNDAAIVISSSNTANTPMALLKRDSHHYTYADYIRWSGTYGEELIDGTAYVREPPAPSPSHQGMVVGLCRQVDTALKGKPYRVYVAPFDVRLPKSAEQDEQVDTVVQPDVLIVCDLQKIDARGMRGAPDWVAEVLSPYTASHDQVVKLPAYERAGVREVWLVHPIDRTLAIYQLEAGRYGRADIFELKGKTQIAAVPGVTIDWDEVLVKIS
jgi:Uma2 family endonuclease